MVKTPVVKTLLWSNYLWSKCGQSVVKHHLWSNSPMVKTPPMVKVWSNPTYGQSPLGSKHAMVKALPSKAKKRSHTSTNRISTYKTFILHLPEYDTLPEWKLARTETCPNGHLPEWTLAEYDTCPNERLPEWTLTRIQQWVVNPLSSNYDQSPAIQVQKLSHTTPNTDIHIQNLHTQHTNMTDDNRVNKNY